MLDNTTNSQLNAFFQGKNINMPVDLIISDRHYQCTEVLRLLPKKRLVVKAQDDNGNQQVIKLFAKQKKGRIGFSQEQRGYQLAKCTDVNVPQLIIASTIAPACYAIVYQYLKNSQSFTDDKKTLALYGDALITMAAMLHKAGIYQADFHLNNILIVAETLYLIDFSAIKQQGMYLDKFTSLANLAMLVAQFKPCEQQLLIDRLPQYYKLRAWQFNADEDKQFNVYVHKAWHRRKANYLSKKFRDCSMTAYRKICWLEYGFCRDFFNQAGESFIKNIDLIMATGQVLKAGNSTTIVAVEYADKKLVIKRYNIKGFYHFLSRCCRRSRAAVSWRNSNLLQLLGIATPKSLGFIEKRIGWFRSAAYLVSEKSDGKTIAIVFGDRLPTDSEQYQLRNIFTMLKKYHISHGDLKASNLLVNNKGRIELIDLDAMKEHATKSNFLRAFDKDKNRFCRNWQKPALAQLCRDIIS